MIYVPLRGLNPVPWKAPSANWAQRHLYKAAEVVAYQHAINEEVTGWLAEHPINLSQFEGDLALRFWFWRRLSAGITAGAGRRAHQADATNMQKSTEDALQGVLFDNDRDVRDVQSVIVDQGPEVHPGLIIGIEHYTLSVLPIPTGVLHDFHMTPVLARSEHDPNVGDIF